jgi:hypothetical protein
VSNGDPKDIGGPECYENDRPHKEVEDFSPQQREEYERIKAELDKKHKPTDAGKQ